MPDRVCKLSIITPAYQDGDHLFPSILKIREAVQRILVALATIATATRDFQMAGSQYS